MSQPPGRARTATADVARLRQTTQYTCCATSIASALHALGKTVTEDDVNRVLGAAPMAGASWEAMLATVQYFGCRGTLVVPATPRMLKEWTDQGIPVVIAWNPEGRPWSHASTVFDVVEGEDGKLTVHVMDSNIPNPDETVRILDADSFCQKWSEKVSDSLIVRRPAMAVTLEVSSAGRQVIAASAPPGWARMQGGWKFSDADFLAWISREERMETVRDRDIPSLMDLTNDGEMFADGPSEAGDRIVREHARWVSQGWWPKQVPVEKWVLSILHRARRMAFEATFDDDSDALRASVSAFPSLRNQRRPPWLLPVPADATDPRGNPMPKNANRDTTASMSRHCEFYLASDGRWYMELADREYGGKYDANTWGPFASKDAAEKFLRNFSNPGGTYTDATGKKAPPTESPNGRPVKSPSSYNSWRWAADTREAAEPVVTLKDKPREYGRTEYGKEFVTEIMRHPGNGRHHNRDLDVAKGRSRKPKHRNRDVEASASDVADRFLSREK